MKKFNILKLDAKTLLKCVKENQPYVLKQDDKNEDTFLINDETVMKLHSESFDSNAMFEQILDVLKPISTNSNSLKQSFIYVSFSASDTLLNSSLFSTKLNDKAENLFLNGFSMQFSDGKQVKFSHFERSSSNAKKCILSFVDDSIRHELTQRVSLDIDFSKGEQAIN